MSMRKILLYSGGMDSWLISYLWVPDVKLYIDTGSSYAAQEIKRLPPDVLIVPLDLSRFERADKIIPLRNLYFAMTASNYGDEICLGATYGDRVLDKSPAFAEKASELLSYLYRPQHWTEGKTVNVVLPYKDFTKAELLAAYIKQGGDVNTAFHESFSCYAPDAQGHECWRCKPCARKAVAFLLNGYRLDRDILHGVRGYLDEVIPQITAGTYGRGEREEREILRAYEIIKEDQHG